MATSEARIIANRQNALKSTGPKTPEGKDRSRANALKHGLCSTSLVPEDLALVQQRATQWYQALKPQCAQQMWLVDQIAVSSIRIERAERMERRLRDRAMLRAEINWDEDRMIEVEALGARLSRRPSEIVCQLRGTPQGCDWLLTRWSILEVAALNGGSWSVDQTRLAFDLLGTPLEGRQGRKPGDLMDLDDHMVEPVGGLVELTRREMASIRERRESVADLDEVDRAIVATDQFDEPNAELKRLRRYENTLHHRLRWCFKEIHQAAPPFRTNPDFKPDWVERLEPPAIEPMPEPPVAKAVNPPFDLTPDEFPEPGQDPDIPKIIAARREKKIRKAEARRVAKRRKVEKLRA